MTHHTGNTLITAAAVALILSGCSSDTGADDTTSAAEEPAPSRCEDVAPGLAKAILRGAEDGVGKLEPGAAAAVRSEDYDKVWMIAVRFSGAGVDDEVGVWASNSLDPGNGVIMAVDGFAQEFTVWPDADKTDAAMSIADDGADQAVECVS